MVDSTLAALSPTFSQMYASIRRPRYHLNIFLPAGTGARSIPADFPGYHDTLMKGSESYLTGGKGMARSLFTSSMVASNSARSYPSSTAR